MSDAGQRVLVVDDENSIRRYFRAALSAQGFTVYEAANGEEAVNAVLNNRPDIIILDLGLPDFVGIEVTRRLREWSQTPIIILSVREAENDKIAALDAGADDYLTKPFGTGELMARMRVAMRRLANKSDEPVLQVDDLKMDLSRRLVLVNEKEISLTHTEYDILRLLMQNAGKVLTHRHLLRQRTPSDVGWSKSHGDWTKLAWHKAGNFGPTGLAVDAEQNIILVGIGFENGEPRRYVARFHPDGALVWEVPSLVGTEARGVGVQPDGKIYVAGAKRTGVNPERWDMEVSVYGADKTAYGPISYSDPGDTFNDRSERGRAVVVLGNGRVVVVGAREIVDPNDPMKWITRGVALLFEGKGQRIGDEWNSSGDKLKHDAILAGTATKDGFATCGYAQAAPTGVTQILIRWHGEDLQEIKAPRLETTQGAAVCNALGYNMESATIVGAHVNVAGENDNQWIFAVRDAADLRVDNLKRYRAGLPTVEREIQDALDQLRYTMDTLSSDCEDLSTVLAQFRFRNETRFLRAGIAWRWSVHPLPEAQWGPEALLHFERILREIFTNILKHAGASEVVVDAGCDAAQCHIHICATGVAAIRCTSNRVGAYAT